MIFFISKYIIFFIVINNILTNLLKIEKNYN